MNSSQLKLPSGRTVSGRALRSPAFPTPDFSLFLLGRTPTPPGWNFAWVKWLDFWLPSDLNDARQKLTDVWERSATQNVEVVCGGGRGRTGTALACIAVLDGVPREEAIAYVRKHYHPRAVETPWQRRLVMRF